MRLITIDSPSLCGVYGTTNGPDPDGGSMDNILYYTSVTMGPHRALFDRVLKCNLGRSFIGLNLWVKQNLKIA